MLDINTNRVAHFVLCLILLTNGESHSQEVDSDRDLARLIGTQLHEFFDPQGKVVGVGRTVALSDKHIVFVDVRDERHNHEIRKLSNQDRLYCQDLQKQLGAIKRSRKSAVKIEKQLVSGKTKNQIRACVQLRKLGIGASEQVSILRDLILNSNDPQLMYESLISFTLLCDTTMDNLDFVLNHAVTQNGRLYWQVQSNPQDFLLAISRWQNDAIPYLRQVAFTGESTWNPDVKQHVKNPITFSTTGGKKRVVVQYACTALGNIPFKSIPIFSAVLSRANTAINNRKDEKTIVVILLALRNQGSKSAELIAIIKIYESKYPQLIEAVKASTDARHKFHIKSMQLVRRSKMRHYKNKQGKYIFWGELRSTENENAVFLTREVKYVSIPISEFSRMDREHILSIFPPANKK